MIIVRYADDFVLGFQYRSDAVRFQQDATARLARYGLDLHPDKTRLIEFGRFAAANRKRRGQGKPETFDFLGFTHYCRRTRGGKFGLGRKPIAKRMSRKLRAIKKALKRRMHEDERETGQWLGQVLHGWLRTARLTGEWTESESLLEQRRSQFMLLRESCAGCREAVGEALTAARVGRALSIVNLVRSAETVLLVEGNTDCTATGEGQAGSAVSKTSRHARTSSIGSWEIFALPRRVVAGAAEGRR